MYRFDWLEKKKLEPAVIPADDSGKVRPVVWRLGFTSLLTDISAEIVNSTLPAFVVLYLHAGPLVFGAIDGIYHGMAVALLGLAGGILADRRRQYKQIAAAGYGLSAVCKLGLLAVGSSTGWLGVLVALDRAGKGVRTAPRDALLSLGSKGASLTNAFAVHRAMDAGGTMIGPLIAFFLLSRYPNAYNALWLTSFVFALLGLAVIALFVDNPREEAHHASSESLAEGLRNIASGVTVRKILVAGTLLAAVTLSDGFVYLLLQSRSGVAAHYFPLYYMVTAGSYMLLSIPAGRLANRVGRTTVFLGAHALLLLMYASISTGFLAGGALPLFPLLLFGLFYAGSEGILMAMASEAIEARRRTTGLALLNTGIGLARMSGSLAFGWMWHSRGIQPSVLLFGSLLAAAILAAGILLRRADRERTVET